MSSGWESGQGRMSADLGISAPRRGQVGAGRASTWAGRAGDQPGGQHFIPPPWPSTPWIPGCPKQRRQLCHQVISFSKLSGESIYNYISKWSGSLGAKWKSWLCQQERFTSFITPTAVPGPPPSLGLTPSPSLFSVAIDGAWSHKGR